ncbi:MAG: radical SAM protein [Desulfatiglandaceae bacterium]|jgi:histone acetyltransferase (RNA polymerase elongator complex component)
MKKCIVPVFIPNQGCPHQCLFCDQEKITSEKHHHIDGSSVRMTIEKAVHSRNFDSRNAELAFYGGTFTSLETDRMNELLDAVAPYLQKGLFGGIRVSTRPDSLDEERLEIMKRSGVRTVELGVQSMDDRVLTLSARGHSAEDSVRAVHLLRQAGFSVGVQLMPGLPGDSEETFLSTIDNVIALAPDMARIYPALVIRGTGLARLYQKEKYRPLTLDQAVEICAESCRRLEGAEIPVIRMGLMSSPTLMEPGQVLAGPWHPAFGFLVRCSIYRKVIEPQLPSPGKQQKIRIRASGREVPLLRGYKNSGLGWITSRTGAKVVGIEVGPTLPPGKIDVERV